MKRYYIITPEYGEVVPILDYGQGPVEYNCDVVEVEAENKRDAIVLGVKYMREHSSQFHWFRHADGNPFAGVRTEEVAEDEACE